MTFDCPGGLRAKSLESDGEISADYVDWFWSDELGREKEVLSTVCDVSANDLELKAFPAANGKFILIRSQLCEKADRQNRAHRRFEAFLVNDVQLKAMQNGLFTAWPRRDERSFHVEIDESKVDGKSPNTEIASERVGNGANDKSAKEERKIMSNSREVSQASSQDGKVWFFVVLAISMIALNAWLWYSKYEYGDVISSQKAKLAECERSRDDLQKANDELRKENDALRQYKELKTVLAKLETLTRRQEESIRRLEAKIEKLGTSDAAAPEENKEAAAPRWPLSGW